MEAPMPPSEVGSGTLCAIAGRPDGDRPAAYTVMILPGATEMSAGLTGPLPTIAALFCARPTVTKRPLSGNNSARAAPAAYKYAPWLGLSTSTTGIGSLPVKCRNLPSNTLAFFGTGTARSALTEALEESSVVQKNENSGTNVFSRVPEYS